MYVALHTKRQVLIKCVGLPCLSPPFVPFHFSSPNCSIIWALKLLDCSQSPISRLMVEIERKLPPSLFLKASANWGERHHYRVGGGSGGVSVVMSLSTLLPRCFKTRWRQFVLEPDDQTGK